MKKYSAKLLFQFRADLGGGKSDTMRRCEERIILLSARNAQSALRKAKAHGKRSELEGTAEAGNPILFEFIGVMDMIEVGIECEPEEVWYEYRFRKLPMERKDRFIPPEEELDAIRLERQARELKTPTR